MNREGHNNVRFFVGPEVEHTPAYSKKTLFVVGKQPVQEIIKNARENGASHIFMGANHSFSVDPAYNTSYWDETITELLDRGFWVTLDYQAHEHKNVLTILNKGVWQCRTFVPLLSVRIPELERSNPNLTVKIDDIDFKATNSGVWCLHYRELMDSNRFTDWADYSTDSVIHDVKQEPVSTPISKNFEEKVTTKIFEESKSEDLNNTELGLDTTPTTALKPEVDDFEAPKAEIVLNVPDLATEAVEAYAEGATADPIKETAKKTKGKK